MSICYLLLIACSMKYRHATFWGYIHVLYCFHSNSRNLQKSREDHLLVSNSICLISCFNEQVLSTVDSIQHKIRACNLSKWCMVYLQGNSRNLQVATKPSRSLIIDIRLYFYDYERMLSTVDSRNAGMQPFWGYIRVLYCRHSNSRNLQKSGEDPLLVLNSTCLTTSINEWVLSTVDSMQHEINAYNFLKWRTGIIYLHGNSRNLQVATMPRRSLIIDIRLYNFVQSHKCMLSSIYCWQHAVLKLRHVRGFIYGRPTCMKTLSLFATEQNTLLIGIKLYLLDRSTRSYLL